MQPQRGTRKFKALALALALGAMPLAFSVSCNPTDGSFSIFRDDDSDYYYDDSFFGCPFFDCYFGDDFFF